MKRVLLAIGTRPETIKLAPVYLALKTYTHFETALVSTGQHREMIDPLFTFFDIKPEIELNIMQADQTLPQLTGQLFLKLDETIKAIKPDLIMVQGDTTTAMVTSMLSFYHRIPLAHVEAGLRSHDRWAPFPEEINRSIASLVADIHFAPTERAAENIKGKEGDVLVVGNTVVDSLFLGLNKVRKNVTLYEKKFADHIKADKKIILITAHRRESFDTGLERIFQGILELARKRSELLFLFPVHFNPNVRKPVNHLLKGHDQIALIHPVHYDDMIYLMSRSFLILTDSGGIQEEAPSLNIPVLVLRDVTERREGIDAGCALLVGTQTKNIVDAVEKLLGDVNLYRSMQMVANPYGDGSAAKKIAKTIAERLK